MDNNRAWKNLFYYGDNEDETIHFDIMTGVQQRKNTMFFHSAYGAGVHERENRSGLLRNIQMKYNIAEFMANRNIDLAEETRLQAITSEASIFTEENMSTGELDVLINFYKRDLTPGEVKL